MIGDLMYDYLIVGAGLFGSVCAHELKKKGKKVLVVEKRNHIAGNAYTEDNDGIQVHKYGAHIFHTNDKKIWDYVNSFVEFNRFTNSPLANYEGKLYNLPFNMNTFYQLWGTKTPAEAMSIIEEQRKELDGKDPENLEEKAISLVGRDIYEKLIKGYTEKQWGRKATELPAFIISRLPVRMTYDNNYFSDRYQGIPIGGYTKLVAAMLEGIEVRLGVDYLALKDELVSQAKTVIYTGPIDEYFDYCYGKLEYRSLQFETETLNEENYQGNAVINYTEAEIPYTRIIEHKHFDPVDRKHTVVTKEFPSEWKAGDEPYYPINDQKTWNSLKNTSYYQRMREMLSLADGLQNINIMICIR
jgi:UDP-galactopyranose mutase (EC 5.4.99.9)